MVRLSREREPQLESTRADEDHRRPRRRNAWLANILIVFVLAACGVGGYYLADSVFLASQRLAPATSNNAAEAPAAEPSPEPVTPDKPRDEALAQPTAPATNSVATPTSRKIGSWTLICPGTNSPRTDCALVQRLVDAEKRPVLVWSVTRDSDGTVRAMWQTALDVDRTAGLILDAGDGKPRTVPFAGCSKQYCLVRGILARGYLPTLAAAPSVTVAIRSANGAPATYALAATGLADGLAWLGGGQ